MLFDDADGEIERSAVDQNLPANILRDIACPAGESVCIGCRLREDCFLYRARKRALAAQVVLVNHALLFSDLSTNGALLGPYDILVIDEAHHLPEVATQYLALTVSPKSIKGSAQSLQMNTYDEVVAYVREMIAYEDSEAARAIERLWLSIMSHVEEAYRAAIRFFAQLTEIIRGMPNEKGRLAGANSYTENLRYYEGAPIFYNTENEKENITANLAASKNRHFERYFCRIAFILPLRYPSIHRFIAFSWVIEPHEKPPHARIAVSSLS